MRIVGGKMRGVTLYGPKNKKTRPLKDLARESIFNIIQHSNKILFKFEKSNILDLYAGTGSFGLECLSRQAENVYFIEKREDVIEILNRNIEKLKLKKKTKVFSKDVFHLIKKISIFDTKFDLIFCDPPFEDNSVGKLIELIFSKNLLKKNGIIIIHRKKNTDDKFENYFKVIDERTYGMSKIIFGKFLL